MIYLLRHGETVWNRADRRQGHLDSPLTLKGIAQARAVAGLLGDLLMGSNPPIQASPLGRAWQTAAIVAETLGRDSDDIVTDQRLAEISYGHWEGLTRAEIRRADPDYYERRVADRWSIPPRGGESFVDLQARLAPWLAEQDLARDMIVIGHGALNRALVGLLVRLSPEQALALPEDQQSLFRLSDGFYDIAGPAELPSDYDVPQA
jgi:broad specificity phosphatase PhoE